MRAQEKNNEELHSWKISAERTLIEHHSSESMIKEKSREWFREEKKSKELGKVPINILYYRDGVSGGQYMRM
jgi:hypothetical protein